MSQLPHTLYRAAEVRELDRIAIEEYGISGIQLMGRAGMAVFDELRCRWPDARRIVVVCGAGNNGGDGYVVARLAREQAFDVTLVALRDPATLIGDARTAWGAAQAAGLSVQSFHPEIFNGADVVVDAIFGTGLDREVSGEWAEVIEAINGSNAPVLAVDIPSGIDADSGRVLGKAIVADATVTFIGLKCGMLTGAGRDCCGVIRFEDLGVPQEIYEQKSSTMQRIDWSRLKPLLPPRRRSAHKGDHGHVLIVGGNQGMAGAVRLAAEASLRVGSGLTTVATRSEHVAAMAAARPEVMWRGVEEVVDLQPLLQRATVVVIGPGLGQDRWAQQMFNCVIESQLPLVVDADALNLLALEPLKHEQWILTPHPGEAGRLLQSGPAEVNRDRFYAVAELSHRYGGVIVLKGAGTLIADSSGQICVCSDGNPGMATAGMGDLLTGVIAGLLAQGLNLSQSAQGGVALHAAAADKAAIAGERGLMASDVVGCLRGFVN